MNAPLTHSEISGTPLSTLANFSARELLVLKAGLSRDYVIAKSALEHLDRALNQKYSERAKALRMQEGKDTGVVHFTDDDVRVSFDLPKRVDWDQEILSTLYTTLVSTGQDPAKYIDCTYRVSETKFKEWDTEIRQLFEPARTVKGGKPSLSLEQITE